MHEKILFITAACYLLAVILLYMGVTKRSSGKRLVSAGFALAGVLFHIWAEAQHWLVQPTPHVSLLNVMSLCALAAVVIPLGTFTLKNSLFDASLVTLPISVLILVAEGLISTPVLEITEKSPGMTVHIITSIAAFGILSIAGAYAIFVSLIDHLLRKHSFNKLVQSLPALETLEQLLMHLIRVGLAVLTVSLGTGLVFVDDLFGQHLGHKTILSIFAWVIFALLLWGRWKRGWRGRVAVRMTLTGIVVLLLSYFGSKLVLEIILERSWHI
jgi:ABC-type uncharacterized transport system permease subunit